MGSRVTKALAPLFEGGDEELQGRVLGILGQHHDKDALGFLQKALLHHDPTVSERACGVLTAQIPGLDNKERTALSTALDKALSVAKIGTLTPVAIAQAVGVLVLLEGEKCRTTLLRFATSKNASIIRQAALRALAGITLTPAQTVTVLGYIAEEDMTHVVRPAMQLLEGITSWNASAGDALGRMLESDSEERCLFGVGAPLVVVASLFLIYSLFGQSMPELISHKGVSLNRLIGYQWLGGEAVFGISIDVSVSFVFLFVLFGSLLDKAGAGQYFLGLAFALVGRLRGGPAKAAILASGMTGLISGSSIANVATTGVFTIPVMKKTGLPAVKAGAIEVAASTNGQMMPPIMGAAAFIMAEFIGISYFDVIFAALIPAVLSYLGLFYISHLEALKLGLVGMPKADVPPLVKTFMGGIYYLIPIVMLVYLLMVERWTAASAVFYSILALMAIIVVQHVVAAVRGDGSVLYGLAQGIAGIYLGLVAAPET